MSQVGRSRRVAAVIALGLFLGCSSPEERLAAHIERAEALTDEGEIDEAILEYRSALKIDSEQLEVNEKLGNLLLSSGDLSGTFYLSEALRIDPDRLDLAMQLARVLLVTGQTDEAHAVIETAKKLDPDAPVVHSAESEYFLYRNDPEQALAAAKRAVEHGPDDANTWMQLGRAYEGQMRMGELTKKPVDRQVRRDAIAAFEKADELAGGMVPARVERARLIGQRQQSREIAKEAFVAAVELAKEQQDADMHFIAATAAEEFAVKNKSIDFRVWALREKLAADPSQLELWEELAKLVDGGSHMGIVIYGQLLKERPDDVGAHLLFSKYLTGQDRPRDAIRHLKKTIADGLDSPLLWEQLIRLQLAHGRRSNARASFVQMSDEYPDNRTTSRTRARVALADGREDDAIRILREEVRETGSFEYHRLLAVAYYRQGDLEGASDALDRALEVRDDFAVGAVRLRASIDHDREDWTGTLQALRALSIRGHALTGQEQVMWARALYALDRAEQGRRLLERTLAGKNPPAGAAIEFARREGSAHPDEARAYLAATIAKNPGSSPVLDALVDLELKSGRLKEALFLVNNSVKAGLARPETLLLRARILMKTKQYEKAEADALRAFEADPKLPGAVDLLYSIYAAQGRLEEAKASFEEADAAGVLHPGARLLLGRIYLREGDAARARAMFRKILKEDPEAASAKAGLAIVIADSGVNLDYAVELAEEAQKLLRSDPAVADTLGYVYLRKGLHEAALQQFMYGIELNDDRPGTTASKLHYHRGLTLDALSRSDEAADAFEKALALDADFPEADDARERLGRSGRPS